MKGSGFSVANVIDPYTSDTNYKHATKNLPTDITVASKVFIDKPNIRNFQPVFSKMLKIKVFYTKNQLYNYVTTNYG